MSFHDASLLRTLVEFSYGNLLVTICHKQVPTGVPCRFISKRQSAALFTASEIECHVSLKTWRAIYAP